MRVTRLVLIPTTVAWFAGAMWYMARQGVQSHDRSNKPKHNVHASLGILGPENVPSKASAPAETLPVVASKGPAPFADHITLRFVKNTQRVQWNKEELDWLSMVHDLLIADGRTNIVVTGHTDADGDPDLNERLSLERAEAVRASLIEQGFPAERITAVGKGAKEPVADNLTSVGKAKNRRVEVILHRAL